MASIPWLGDVLRAAGVAVVEEGNWQARRRSGSFEPIGVLWHHTAATSSPSRPYPSLDVVIEGRSDLAGPLCHALVDYNGVFHLISANRANHAGESRGSGPIPPGDGNATLIGWEIDYAGDQDPGDQPDQAMTSAQYEASVIATAAVLGRLGRDASYARGHRETSVDGKRDPSYVDLDRMRADVAARMGTPPRLDNPMYHQIRRADGTWTGFQPIAGYGTTAPGGARDVAITGVPGVTQVLAVDNAQLLIIGLDGRVYHEARASNGTWSGLQPVAGYGTTTPASASAVAIAGLPDLSSQVLIIGADGKVYHQARASNGTWTGFQPLPGAGTSAPAGGSAVAIAGFRDGSSQVLILGAAGVVYHQRRDPNGFWSGFAALPGAGTTLPAKGQAVAITGLPNGTAQVLIIGVDGKVYHQERRTDATWSGFQPVAGYGTTLPAAAKDVAITAMSDDSAHIAIIGADDGVYHQVRRRDGTWTGFQPVTGAGTPTTAKGSHVALGTTYSEAQLVIVGR